MVIIEVVLIGVMEIFSSMFVVTLMVVWHWVIQFSLSRQVLVVTLCTVSQIMLQSVKVNQVVECLLGRGYSGDQTCSKGLLY